MTLIVEEDFVCQKLLLLQVQVKVLVLRLQRLVEDGFKVGVLDYNAETAEKAVAELSADKAFAVVADVSKQAEVAAAFQKSC